MTRHTKSVDATTARAAPRGTKPAPAGAMAAGAKKAAPKNAGAMNILTSIGEVMYDWSLSDDAIRWGGNAHDVLKIESIEAISTGKKFGALLSADNLSTPQDSVVNATSKDMGVGVPYQIEYEMMPTGPDGDQRLWVEDTGRWFAGDNGCPEKAHGVLRVINSRHEDEQKQAYFSRFDPLTGQVNRARLVEVLDETYRTCQKLRTRCAFLVISLDNLATINEAYGFDSADRIIAKVSNRIKTRLRGGDVLGRFSGNKFGVVLMNCGRDDIDTAAQRFLSSVTDEVITTEQGAVAASVTIGGVCLPGGVQTVNEAMAFAQEALDAAKASGSGSFVCYEPSRVRNAERRHNLDAASGLLSALDEKRLRIAYQPVLTSGSQTVAFHECLMRLEQEDGTIMPASALMPIAGKLGLDRLIDERMLTLALEDLVAFPQARLSLNLSPQTVVKSDWLDRLTAGLRGLPDDTASRLIVEITETAAIEDLEETAKFISRLRTLGAGVAIDDFGADYMSLRNLKRLEPDMVKIDGALVENLAGAQEDRVIVGTLVDLANAFALKTVAEWVSDATSVTLLQDMGVDYLQGNHLAEPDLARPWQAPTKTRSTENSDRELLTA